MSNAMELVRSVYSKYHNRKFSRESNVRYQNFLNMIVDCAGKGKGDVSIYVPFYTESVKVAVDFLIEDGFDVLVCDQVSGEAPLIISGWADGDET